MTDIGFGLIDRRTVLTVLFVMVIAQVWFGQPLPINTTNAGLLFIDLMLLTGYIYLARSIYRLPVAALFSLIASALKVSQHFEDDFYKYPEGKPSVHLDFLIILLRQLWFLLLRTIPILLVTFFYIFTFGDWIESDNEGSLFYLPGLRELNDAYIFPKIILGTLDRIGLIFIVIAATLPSLNSLVKGIGIAGLVIMVIVYALRGDFTALIKDAIEKKIATPEKS